MGQVIGATDGIGASPSERPFDPHDILGLQPKVEDFEIGPHVVGIGGAGQWHHRQQIEDSFGRPVALTSGKPIADLW